MFLNAHSSSTSPTCTLAFGLITNREGDLFSVELGDVIAQQIPILAPAGRVSKWQPPSIGEQVAVLIPDGDISGAVIIGGLYTNANPAPSNTEFTKIKFGSLKSITETETGFEIEVSGEIEINAQKIKLNGDLEVNGNINSTGTITGDNDVIGGGKSLKSHKHGLVKAGIEQSGTPL